MGEGWCEVCPSAMHSMTEDDAAYTALLTQLLSDSSSARNARVHSWIEHQYDFALSEQHPSSRSPSPSPSSSIGAHRTFDSDRPDSPLLPRSSADCPSYDALFFPLASDTLNEVDEREERERERALRFLVQEMAHWKLQSTPATPHRNTDKPLPAPPPPSPATSTAQSTSSRVLRSRSSSTRISRLPSFTSTLSSDQSQPQDVFAPPLPVSVIIHGEPHHELVLRHDHHHHHHPDVYLHTRNDSFTHHSLHGKEQEIQFLSPVQDDRDSLFPSPTLSSFSCAYSRETSITTPNASFPASPASATFASRACLPENIALPASPEIDRAFADADLTSTDRDANDFPLSPSCTALPLSPSSSVFPSSPSSASFPASPGMSALPACPSVTALPVSPSTTVFPPSPASSYFPPADTARLHNIPAQSQGLQAQRFDAHSQSRWSVATTASLAPSASETKSGSFLVPRTPSKDKKDKELKTPRKRTRFISLISRFSPGRSETSSAATTNTSPPDDAEYDSADESDIGDTKEKEKPRKAPSKKSSLASLRASFSLSRTSFAPQRPTLPSPSEEIPPLPTSPTRTSFNATRSPVADADVSAQAIPPVPKVSSSRIPSRTNHTDTPLPPIPQSASTITSFHNASQGSLLQTPGATSASTSRVSLLPVVSNHSASKISLFPPPSKRTSLASAAGIEVPVSIHPMPSPAATPARAKSIFRIPAKPKTRTNVSGAQESGPTPSKLPVPSTAASPPAAVSKIPQTPSKFTPPAKLASVLAGQGPRSSSNVAPVSSPPASKLPTPPSRIVPSPKVVRPMQVPEDASLVTSKLPLPLSTKNARVGTVKGFWRRQ
ncbi:hypothetical protein F5I97DRAFT_370725 [Phlebopus sp. FC_14]|nr:hypothetical protein F5I97DRAFT_370725 [Phlebopus sp. FC_14]